MNTIEKFTYLISEYNKNNYTTRDFCELFELYYRDFTLPKLPDFTERWLQDLDELCGRFSEYPEDFAISHAFVGEKIIKTFTKDFSPNFPYGE